jgi:hypothetical protein
MTAARSGPGDASRRLLARPLSRPLVVALIAELVLLALWFMPVWNLALTRPGMNAAFRLVLLVALLATFMLCIPALRFRAMRLAAYVIAGLMMLPLAMIAPLAYFDVSDELRLGRSSGYERLSELTDGAVTYRAYLSNCGAVCSFQVEIRREIDLIPGLRLTSLMLARQNETQATLSRTPAGQISVTIGSDTIVLTR